MHILLLRMAYYLLCAFSYCQVVFGRDMDLSGDTKFDEEFVQQLGACRPKGLGWAGVELPGAWGGCSPQRGFTYCVYIYICNREDYVLCGLRAFFWMC